MALRPDTEAFIRNLIVETEIMKTAKNYESTLAGVESILDVHQDYIKKQNHYIGFLEGGYIGLALTGAVVLAIKLRKK